MLAPFQVFNYLCGGIVAVALFQKFVPAQAAQPVVQRRQGRHVHVQIPGQFINIRGFQELPHPVPSKVLLQIIGGSGGYIREIESFPQQLHIFRLDFLVTDCGNLIG